MSLACPEGIWQRLIEIVRHEIRLPGKWASYARVAAFPCGALACSQEFSEIEHFLLPIRGQLVGNLEDLVGNAHLKLSPGLRT
jgi:hypothetical protein